MPTGLPPSFGHAPGGLRRPLRDRRRPPSAILELPMDKTGRDGNSGLRRRQTRCRAMRSSIRGDTSGADTRPPTHKECLLFPHASVSRAGRVRLQHSSTKPTPCAPPPLFGMPCSMASSRQQPKSREPSIQHGYPSHALPRNGLRTPYSPHRHDATPCHALCF